MRTFIFGVAAGALVAAAVIRFAPPRYRPFGSDSPPPASVTATPAAICGRDTFNVNVNVDRLFPGSSGGDPLEATLEKRQDAFADGLHDRLIRAGLRHELACPVMLDIFGMATENQQGVWVVSAHVRLHVASDTTMMYPSWYSGDYRAVFVHVTEAQADLERALTERVRRFLEFFGKPDDGHVASPVPYGRSNVDWSWLQVVAVVVLNALVLWIWKPWAGAYAKVTGELSARQDSLGKILEEVRAVTATQKVIEAKVSGEMWQQQWRQGQKLKIYSQVLQAINEYSIWLSDVSEGRKFGSEGSPLSTMKKDSAQIAEDFHAAYAVAPLFISKDSLELLETAKAAFSYHSSPFPDHDVKDADKKWDLLTGVRRDLSSSARLDLAPPAPSPNGL